ncbi:hypothetical protein PENTCL1PPCAC_30473 [Pristionchus entomophagus]|uniref:G protein-coupled receptor n=1 Tax=Pristionchus entomophagus TaxID=358040 RepID=A0AAV5THV0_9BILA|nr:hypothetical protein PENTCL1PPCAC_16057 [Pristionchus entomophagus]GMT08299.1 hypothetical protein PENTCL1PPCAC_30473 [Pristionchus entomophagus]
MLELLRPMSRFHCFTTCVASTSYLLYGRMLQDEPCYPIFEETIAFVQLQGIFLPVLFMIMERKARYNRFAQLNSNNASSTDFVARYNVEIMRGW